MRLTAYQHKKLQKMPNPRLNAPCFFFFFLTFFSPLFSVSRLFIRENGKIRQSLCERESSQYSICYFMKKKHTHTLEQNYVRRSPGNIVRLYLWDTYRGLWRQTAKNILTVFWIRMMAVARNSIFFITEIKQRWKQLITTIKASFDQTEMHSLLF